jgi:hypothetical protein
MLEGLARAGEGADDRGGQLVRMAGCRQVIEPPDPIRAESAASDSRSPASEDATGRPGADLGGPRGGVPELVDDGRAAAMAGDGLRERARHFGDGIERRRSNQAGSRPVRLASRGWAPGGSRPRYRSPTCAAPHSGGATIGGTPQVEVARLLTVPDVDRHQPAAEGPVGRDACLIAARRGVRGAVLGRVVGSGNGRSERGVGRTSARLGSRTARCRG